MYVKVERLVDVVTKVFKQAAAKALSAHTDMKSRKIVEEALKITSGICIYTNESITIEELNA